ncbi:MAG: Citrate transporter [Methanoregulaceae archaeon PtaB.Bin056]|nr:MAG: Citrate transporter [Methanoregulaceae archaeon PtaB.Bin056]
MEPALSLPPLPIVVLAAVFLLIAIRQVGRFRLRIWQVMCGGAIAVIVLRQISLSDAVASINLDVMVFLLSMFIVGEAMERSGYLHSLSFRLFARARNGEHFILLVLFGMGLLSALLMNDTVAIIGTPIVIAYACRFGVHPKTALLALCVAVTIGSVMSPIGNPQNLLVATYSGLPQPFLAFLFYLGVPTLLNLGIAYFVLTRLSRVDTAGCTFDEQEGQVRDARLAEISRASLAIILVLIGIRVITGPSFIPLALIAVAGALPLVVFSNQRVVIVRNIDWPTLVFFASMFILMQSVYLTGFFQAGLDFTGLQSIPLILASSVLISQFISNVPFVALFQPLIAQQGLSIEGVMALAAGSTIAGNLTILGAASNVIVVENAEKRGYTITFWEFFRVGLPLTIANCVVYWIFLSLA